MCSLSFTQGFLVGQLSIVVLIGAFIKFFVFGEVPSHESTASSHGNVHQKGQQHLRSSSLLSASPQRTKTKRSSSSAFRGAPSLTPTTILSKTFYNVNSHQPESLDWFNVLIAQTISQFRDDANEDEALFDSLTDILNGPQKPDFLSEIKITQLDLGDEFPILSNCRVHPIEDGSSTSEPRLQARMDVDLSDAITLGVDTKLILNYPRPKSAVLPVALSVSVIRFSGTLSISFLPSSTQPSQNDTSSQPQVPSTTPTTLAFSFLPDYRLDLSVRSLVGSRSRLQDIPKISQLVESRLHQWIDERCVEPRMQQVVLPSFWPRKKNMRESSIADGGEMEGRDSGTRTVGVHGSAGSRNDSTGRSTLQDQDAAAFEEGLRARKRDFSMPGTMPGMLVN